MENDFAFLARQKRITIDGEDFYIDLLFYHRKMKRLVVIELKLEKFKPEHKGQVELYLKWLEKYEKAELNAIKLNKSERAVLVEVNMPLFRESVQNASVKKTLTIPKWINDLAEKNKINFSQVLQTALKNALGLKRWR